MLLPLGHWACSAPSGPVLRETAFVVDAEGRIIEQTDRVLDTSTRWTFSWDSRGNLVERRTAQQATLYGYDADGRLLRIDDPPTVVRVSYGEVDRIERDFDGDGAPEHVGEVAWRDGALWTTTQVPRGQPASIREFSRPAPDRLRVVERVGAVTYATWDCGYELGRLARMAYDADADGRPDSTTTWTRDARGWPLEAAADTGWRSTWTYDGDGRLARVETHRGTTLEDSVTYRWTSGAGGTVPPIRVPEQGLGPLVPPAFPRECPEHTSEMFRD